VVKDLGIDPRSPRRDRHFFELECGHVVVRRTQGAKTYAACGHCPKT
jgi:hypothetical protein